jgi:DNA-binding transcriptional LysR family regulator
MSRHFDHIPDAEAFVASVESGSISAGAVRLGTTPSVLSRSIARLEARLGVQLMRRTTRRLSLTDAGRHYLEQLQAAFGLLAAAETAIRGSGEVLSGTVRLSVPTTYGHHRLPALLAGFAAQHPAVTVALSITNRNVDLVAEGVDLAIRLGDLPDSSLVARPLEAAELCVVAAPAYLRQRGVPADLQALATHDLLSFVRPSTGRAMPWLFRDGENEVEQQPSGRWQVSDDVLGVVSLAAAGLGICQTFRFIVAERLQAGQLVEVLPQHAGRTRQFSLIYAPHRRQSAATRALIDCLVGQAAVTGA